MRSILPSATCARRPKGFKHGIARPSGMTLIEVLVALLIFSFGLLGLAGLQSRALRFSSSAEDTNRAALLANEIAFTIVNTQQIDPANSSKSKSDYDAWVIRVATPASGGLPSGVGTVTPPTAPATAATITITWKSPNAPTSEPPNRYLTQIALP